MGSFEGGGGGSNLVIISLLIMPGEETYYSAAADRPLQSHATPDLFLSLLLALGPRKVRGGERLLEAVTQKAW